jgi:hypothetical protein
VGLLLDDLQLARHRGGDDPDEVLPASIIISKLSGLLVLRVTFVDDVLAKE